MRSFLGVFGAFLLAALAFKGAPWGEPVERGAKPLPAEYYDTATVRKVKKKLLFDGMECGACHAETAPEEPDGWTRDPREQGQFHEKIKLQHGPNTRCFNCHNKRKLDAYADYDGAPIAYADIELLCRKCHGPTYRDWKNGAHGRRGGHWDPQKGPQKNEKCIACHDPHWPVFKAIKPAPPPRGPAYPAGTAREENDRAPPPIALHAERHE